MKSTLGPIVQKTLTDLREKTEARFFYGEPTSEEPVSSVNVTLTLDKLMEIQRRLNFKPYIYLNSTTLKVLRRIEPDFPFDGVKTVVIAEMMDGFIVAVGLENWDDPAELWPSAQVIKIADMSEGE